MSPILRQPKKILVIPDVHLKPWMFDRADGILAEGQADCAVLLGDLVDDWGKQFHLNEYEDTINRAVKFQEDHPDTIICVGNHDMSYMHGYNESGYSYAAHHICRSALTRLQNLAGKRWAYVHRAGKCIFSHGGISEGFAREYLSEEEYADVDKAADRINRMKATTMWQDTSPVWLRPNYIKCSMYAPDYLQVVGHTPVLEAVRYKSALLVDTFSTRPDGKPYGNEKMVIVDTTTKKWAYAEEKQA